MVDERSSLQIIVPAVQGDSAGERAEALTLVWNEVGEQVLRGFLGFKPKLSYGGYIAGTIMFTAMLHV